MAYGQNTGSGRERKSEGGRRGREGERGIKKKKHECSYEVSLGRIKAAT